MAYNPFDDVINQDPAYMQVGGEPLTTDQRPGYYANMFPNRQQPTTEEATDAFYENVMKPTFGQFYKTVGYGITEQDLEDAKLNNEIMNALQEKGIAIEEGRNIPLKGSREYYDMVNQLLPVLEEKGYKPQSVLGRLQQTMYGEAKLGYEALDKMPYSELPENYKAAMHPMYALLDAPDMAVLIALPTQLFKQGIKLSPQFVPFIQNLLQKGVGKEEIVQIASKQFPEDMQAIAGINFGPMVEKGQLNLAPDTGGAGGRKSDLVIQNAKKQVEVLNKAAQEARQKRIDDMNIALGQKPPEDIISVRQMLRKLGIGTSDQDVLLDYIKANPDSNIAKFTAPLQVKRADQLTPGILKLLEDEVALRGEPLNLADAVALSGIPKTTLNRLFEIDKNPQLQKLILKRGTKGSERQFYDNYLPPANRQSSLEAQAEYLVLRDMIRSGEFGNKEQFVKIMEDNGIIPRYIQEVIDGKPQFVDGKPKLVSNPAYNADDMFLRRKEFMDLIKKEYFNSMDKEFGQPIGTTFQTLMKKIDERNQLTDYTAKKFVEAVKNNEAFKNQFMSELKRIYPEEELGDAKTEAFLYAKQHFMGQMGHIMPISKTKAKTPVKGEQFKLGPGLEGKMFYPDFMSVNFAAHNIGYQNRAENILKNTIAEIRKGNDSKKNLEKLQNLDKMMAEKNIRTYLRFSKKQMPEEVFNKLVSVFGNKVEKEPNVEGVYSVFLGKETDPTLAENIQYFDKKLNEYITDPKSFKISGQVPKTGLPDEMFISGSAPYIQKGQPLNFEKGGPVHMAIGGNPLENINQQQFAADPGFDGEDYFSQAVESGNLYAFNPFKLLNIFGKIDGVATPNKVKPSILPPPNADNITPALVPSVEKSDFPFQSFMMEKMYSPNAPKSASPEAWKQYLLGGNQPVKQAEIQDSGLLQYLDDYAGYFPGKKIDRETLSQYYETSPVGNLSIKIKEANRPPAEAVEANKLFNHSGKSRHKGAGGLRIDEEGTDYREVVIQAGAIPNESKAFVNSSHFEEPNTIGFSRVANYNNVDGDTVAVIQELQTDMLTSLQKEQDRLQAMLKRLDNVKDKLQRDLNSPDIEVRNLAERQMNEINQKFPPDTIEYLKQNPNLIKPFPNEAGKIMIPDYSKELIDLQKQIDELVKAKVDTGVYELDDSIYSIAELQKNIRDKLYDLNRSVELDDQIKGFQVPDQYQRDELANFAQSDRPQLGYSTHDVKLFPNFPFQSQQDYVDLILKATIKDAQTRGIDKIAIMPAEVGPIKRWNKDRNGPSGKKFIDLYDKVTPQVMKNIAKKYDGTLQIEKIVDPSKAEKGLQYFNKDVDGSFSLLKEDVLNGDLSFGEMDSYINGKLEKAAHDMGPNNVVYTKEISPGQTMDYYVQPTTREQRSMEGVTGTVSDFELVPLGPGDDINAAQLHIVENNPQLVDMYTLTLNSPKAQEPFFLYGKKDGGKIASDGLVSITDIYGDY